MTKELMFAIHADREREIAEALRVRTLLSGGQPAASRDKQSRLIRPLGIADRFAARIILRAR
jgi:hypothetical protein